MIKVQEGDNMKKININEVEQLTGVSKRNIRFYEKEGLIVPERNEVNGYREYREADVRRIKLIRMFRMLDMPLEKISSVLDNECSLETAVSEQKKHLEQQAQELQLAIQFCDRLKNQELQMLDVDSCLYEMGKSGTRGFFQAWVDDYKKIKELNKGRDFTFIPDGAVTNAREFTDVLIEYANKEKKDLVITKESMYPEFTLDGVKYNAERYYESVRGFPVAIVHCFAMDREVKGENVAESRKNLIWFLHKWWHVIVLAIGNIIFIWKFFLPMQTSPEEWVIPIAAIATQGAGLFRYYLFHYNEKV